jgi:hypothetical protein
MNIIRHIILAIFFMSVGVFMGLVIATEFGETKSTDASSAYCDRIYDKAVECINSERVKE